MKQEYWGKLSVLLALMLLGVSCTQNQSASCFTTRSQFQQFFNSGDYNKITSLFSHKAKSSAQLKGLISNVEYMGTVVGKIKSMTLVSDSLNRQKYISHHEQTNLEITFLFDQACQLSALLIQNHYPDSLPLLERNTTNLKLPFTGEWSVSWGGTTVEQNYHNAHRNMQGAFDFVIKDSRGKSYQTDGKSNDDYYAFGQEVIAPCAGEVVEVVKGIKDNQWPKVNPLQIYGNTVVLKTPQEEYLLFAHLKENSITVKKGQKLKTGDLIGLCGNSGYSKEPHLHFIVQNVANLYHPTGAFCYFERIQVNGTLQEDYMPVKGDRIKNINQ